MSLPKPLEPYDAGDSALAEIGGDLQSALTRYMKGTLGEWHALLTDIEKRYEAAKWRSTEGEKENIAGLLEFTRYAVRGFERMATEGPPKQDHLTPKHFSWTDVSAAWQHDETTGRALWE